MLRGKQGEAGEVPSLTGRGNSVLLRRESRISLNLNYAKKSRLDLELCEIFLAT